MIDSNEKTRFQGLARLFGQESVKKLRQSHVCVIGIGGVGSWAVEALARSGIGRITLVDLDDVCVSNVNRQLHALTPTIGRSKVEVMGERVTMINPQCHLHLVQDFLTEENCPQLIHQSKKYDYIFDAIDSLKNKCLIVSRASELGIPVLTAGGAGGLVSPLGLRISDLNLCIQDKLLQRMRKKLRHSFNFPKAEKRPWGIEAVYSPAKRVFPQSDGSVCATLESLDSGSSLKLDCESGLGTASFVTGSFGLLAAAHIVQRLTDQANGEGAAK